MLYTYNYFASELEMFVGNDYYVMCGLHRSFTFLGETKVCNVCYFTAPWSVWSGSRSKGALLIVNCPRPDLYTHQRKLLIIAGMINIMSQH